MGTGKTAVGEIAAKRLFRVLRDNDETLRELTGRSAAEIERDEGIEALHALEVDALEADLAVPDPAVVAAAASTVMSAAGRAALTSRAFVVWLDAAPAESARRMRSGNHRPALGHLEGDDLATRVRRLRAEREAAFRAVADLIVDTSRLTPEQVVERILGPAHHAQ